MRKRYGSWTASMLAVLAVLIGMSAVTQAQSFNPKWYPTISLRNYHCYPDGILRVPTPAAGGERYFLVPVYIYNEVDTTFNPNFGGQHLEPIRSFDFQMTYLTQAMQLDVDHGSPIVLVGPNPTAPPALAKTFFLQYSDQPDPNTGNPFLHRIRLSGASSVPLPMANTSDSGCSTNSGILLWLRFKVVVGNVNAGLLQLDTARFNDHAGDVGLMGTDTLRGNLGGGSGLNGAQNKGAALVQITAQPAFLLSPFSQLSTTDNVNYQLTADLIYDPINGTTGGVTRQLQVSDAIGNTLLQNVNICSDQTWLTLGLNGPGGNQCLFIPTIDYTSSFGSQQKNLFMTANPLGLSPGIYYATITFTSDGAQNSPLHLRLRFIILATPNEPAPGGTGVRLNITNSCSPACTSVVAFGTGPQATSGLDLLYGEAPFTTNDRIDADLLKRCYAYFEQLDLSADAAFQDPTFLGLNRDIRSDKTDTTLVYKVDFSAGDSNSCYPVKVCVDPQDFPAGARLVMRFTQNGSEQGIDLRTATLDANNMRCVTIGDHRITSFYIEYTPGVTTDFASTFLPNAWNLVSLPVIPPNPDARSIFQNISGNPFAYFASIGWQAPAANQVEYGRGYMVKYGSVIGTDASIAGVRTNEIRNIRIDEGWNTVGATSVPLTIDNIFLSPLAGNTSIPQLISDVWEYIPTTGYQQTSFLIPTRGYFIKVDQVGYYNVNTASTVDNKSDFAGKIATRETQVLQSKLSSVLISDVRKNGQKLYFGNAVTTLPESRFEMPGAASEVDARFASNKGNTSFNKSSYVIDIHAKSFPLTMNFSNLQSDVVVRDQNGNVLGTASNGGTITITDANVHSVEIAEKSTNSGTAPASSFSLEQNTPNPFSGATTITFSIPQESPVSLVVYNQLGQVVNTLVNQVVSAGPHTVGFDASNLANGTYYYTLKSGSFVKTERMQIAK